MYEFTDLSYNEIEKLPDGKEKAICRGVDGLLIDGGHHKQWAIEQMLKALGVDLDVLREELEHEGCSWSEGIAP